MGKSNAALVAARPSVVTSIAPHALDEIGARLVAIHNRTQELDKNIGDFGFDADVLYNEERDQLHVAASFYTAETASGALVQLAAAASIGFLAFDYWQAEGEDLARKQEEAEQAGTLEAYLEAKKFGTLAYENTHSAAALLRCVYSIAKYIEASSGLDRAECGAAFLSDRCDPFNPESAYHDPDTIGGNTPTQERIDVRHPGLRGSENADDAEADNAR